MKSDTQLIIDEVYHRMRNNLQVVSGVLRMKGKEMDSEQTIDLIESAIIKIINMEIIHPCIGNNKFEQYDLKTILTNLSSQIKSLHAYGGNDVEFELQTNGITLNSVTTTFLSRIINELIINSYKHAFRGTKNGLIKIEIKKTGYNKYQLVYCDNGNTLKDISLLNNSTSLGFEIIKLFVERLKGTIKYDLNPGLGYTIDFKEIIN